MTSPTAEVSFRTGRVNQEATSRTVKTIIKFSHVVPSMNGAKLI